MRTLISIALSMTLFTTVAFAGPTTTRTTADAKRGQRTSAPQPLMSLDPTADTPIVLGCAPNGSRCTFSSDCCSRNCVNTPNVGRVCKRRGASWTCKPAGHRCTFSSDCCTRNCVNDPRLGRVCKRPGASWTCRPSGVRCTFSSDCCSKRCVYYRGSRVCQ